MLIFIIILKTSLLKTLDNFNLEEDIDEGDLLHIKDYHNLSLKITTSKILYIGFPPSPKFRLSSSITKYSNVITCNPKFAFVTCLEDNIMQIINLETGEVSSIMALEFEANLHKSCAVALDENSIYVLYVKSKEENFITYGINQFMLNDINNELYGPTVFALASDIHTFTYESIDVDQQVDIECISLSDNADDAHIVYFFINPETVNGKTIYILKGAIDDRSPSNIISSNLLTDVKVYKLNYYTIRCIIKYQQIDLIITKKGSVYEFSEVANSYKIYEEELISFNSNMIFLASGTYIKILKSN